MIRLSLSSLQRKGVALLFLILLSESVTLSNAVKLWSSYESLLDSTSTASATGRPTATACSATSASNLECSSASPKTSPLRFLPRLFSPKARAKAKDTLDCCSRQCSHCVALSTDTCATGIPRGGHSHAETLAEAAIATTTTPYGIPLHLWKIIFQAILTSINVACWLLPLRSKKVTENKLGLSLANAFSGGVFLSLAFGHLIPECVHGFQDSVYKQQEALPYMLVLGGYLLIFFVEKVAFDAHDILHEMEHSHEHGTDTKVNGAVATETTTAAPNTGRSAVILLGALAVHSILEMMALGLADSFGDCAILTLSIALHQVRLTTNVDAVVTCTFRFNICLTRFTFFFVVHSVHSQPAESIALLVAFLKSGMPKNQIIQFLSIFSAMGPIGVALGIAVNEFAAPIVDAAMLAIVAGTFVYVGATEVIPEEWEDSEHKWKKFAALMCGIVSIFCITQYTMSLGGH
ncbi:Zinc transporter ZIP1 [Seminavis robusta]|uniref:Zinc transporter ZIP1 n=1 Tax=Seminavis robusta TaxID=568900 RepID=A0A9N8H306_9STRA|nr:Zinc transporter ZIP1 [Seminavis robusta]|eukprot:Sro48_g028160.1 Zinc transporter ZIP1 (463) ;mRNA; r:44685-46073